MINGLKRNKGFTLIELIVVIAVIGILALLAAPKFLRHTEDARLTQIKSDIVSYENAIEAERVKLEEKGKDEDPFINDELKMNKSAIINYAVKGELFHRGGPATTKDLFGVSYYRIKDNIVNSKLKGKFFMNEEGKVFYQEMRINDATKDFVLLTDEDFEFVSDSQARNKYIINGKPTAGYFHYRGKYEKVIIPHEIMGNEVKDYYRMFYYNGDSRYKVGAIAGDNGKAVSAVFSDNPNVTNMRFMFWRSRSTTLDLRNFDTYNVTDMLGMFRESSATTLDLSNFDTSKVTDMYGMFYESMATELVLSSFDTSNVIIMGSMFRSSKATDLNLSNFDTSNVTDMTEMFYYSKAHDLNLSNFDTANVTNMRSMFANVETKSIDLSNFNTSRVTDMGGMFRGSKIEILDLGSFDTSNVTNMLGMFSRSKVTSLNLNSFDTSNVTNMVQMFYYLNTETLDLSNFDISNVSDMREMFYNSMATTIKVKDETTGLKLVKDGGASAGVVTWATK